MATGTGNLPNPSMSFSPFAILTAEEMNNIVENIESVATGSGIGDGAVTDAKMNFKTYKHLGFASRDNVVKDNTGINDDNWRAIRNTADNADLTMSIVCSGGTVYVEVSVSLWSNVDGYKNVRVLLDGTPVGTTLPASFALSTVNPGFGTISFTPSAGTHTLGFQWQRQGGALALVSYRTFSAKAYEVVGN